MTVDSYFARGMNRPTQTLLFHYSVGTGLTCPSDPTAYRRSNDTETRAVTCNSIIGSTYEEEYEERRRRIRQGITGSINY